MRLMQGGKRYQLLQLSQHRGIKPDGRGEFRAAMNDAVPYGLHLMVTKMGLDEIEDMPHRIIVAEGRTVPALLSHLAALGVVRHKMRATRRQPLDLAAE